MFAVNDELAFLEVIVNSAVKLTVHCVILEHVSHVVNGEKVVDGNYFDVIAFGRGAEDKATDTAKTVNTYFCHNFKIILGYELISYVVVLCVLPGSIA